MIEAIKPNAGISHTEDGSFFVVVDEESYVFYATPYYYNKEVKIIKLYPSNNMEKFLVELKYV